MFFIPPLVKIGLFAALGNIVSEVGMKVFGEKQPVTQAIQRVNWTRIIIAAIVAIVVFFLFQRFFERGSK